MDRPQRSETPELMAFYVTTVRGGSDTSDDPRVRTASGRGCVVVSRRGTNWLWLIREKRDKRFWARGKNYSILLSDLNEEERALVLRAIIEDAGSSYYPPRSCLSLTGRRGSWWRRGDMEVVP